MAYKRIEDYGLIGNMHTAALVGNDGSIDWLCLPFFDSPAVFNSLLDDEKGGRFSISAIDSVDHRQIYFPETNILITRFGSDDSAAQVTDFMPVHEQHEEGNGGQVLEIDDLRGDESRIVRLAQGVLGDTTMRMECKPAFEFAGVSHKVQKVDGGVIFTSESGERLSLTAPCDFNVENALVACGIALALKIEAQTIVDGIADCAQVPGRVERVQISESREPTVIVDYAHTPDAIDKLLSTLRPLAGNQLITVFGCGGDRDRSKRPLMAEAVARWSDRVVATSDNPRTEDAMQILDEVELGLGKLQRVDAESLATTAGAYATIPDRRRAIEVAIRIAAPEDMVVIAGKGHEDYQIIGVDRLPFVDRDEARRALQDWSGK